MTRTTKHSTLKQHPLSGNTFFISKLLKNIHKIINKPVDPPTAFP